VNRRDPAPSSGSRDRGGGEFSGKQFTLPRSARRKMPIVLLRMVQYVSTTGKTNPCTHSDTQKNISKKFNASDQAEFFWGVAAPKGRCCLCLCTQLLHSVYLCTHTHTHTHSCRFVCTRVHTSVCITSSLAQRLAAGLLYLWWILIVYYKNLKKIVNNEVVQINLIYISISKAEIVTKLRGLFFLGFLFVETARIWVIF
jgi:hypothetical protein